MNKCWFFHDWTKWSEEKKRQMVAYGGLLMGSKRGEEIGRYIERYQIRECKRCGLIKERILESYI